MAVAFYSGGAQPATVFLRAQRPNDRIIDLPAFPNLDSLWKIQVLPAEPFPSQLKLHRLALRANASGRRLSVRVRTASLSLRIKATIPAQVTATSTSALG